MKDIKAQKDLAVKQIAKLLQQQRNWEAASTQWKELLIRTPNDQEALRSLAYCYHMLGRHDLEQSIIDKLASLNNLDNESVFAIARHYQFHHQPAVALTYFHKLEGIDFRPLDVATGIIECLAESGEVPDEAISSRLVNIFEEMKWTWEEYYRLWKAFLSSQNFRYAFKSLVAMLQSSSTVHQFIITGLMIVVFPLVLLSKISKARRMFVLLFIIIFLFVLPTPWKIVLAILIILPLIGTIPLFILVRTPENLRGLVRVITIVLFIIMIIILSLRQQ